jgi:small basic protein
MINYELILIGSYSIVIAAIIGLIRFPKIHRAYQPFIFITLVAVLNEICSNLLIYFHRSNAPSTNIFGLIECILWLWQFKRWGGFRQKRWEYPLLLSLVTAVWITENIIFGKLFTFSSVYAIAYSFCLVFISINHVNQQIVEEKKNLFTNPKFLICTGAIIFYTYRILVESFYLLDLQDSKTFLTNIFSILVFVNLFVNLLFALAILWIPTRQRFSMPSS